MHILPLFFFTNTDYNLQWADLWSISPISLWLAKQIQTHTTEPEDVTSNRSNKQRYVWKHHKALIFQEVNMQMAFLKLPLNIKLVQEKAF